MIFLNWDDPEDDGGSDLTGFVVERRDAKMHTWRQPVETASSKCECVGIMEGQDYMFRVIAKNKYGMGPPVELGPIKAVDPQGKHAGSTGCSGSRSNLRACFHPPQDHLHTPRNSTTPNAPRAPSHSPGNHLAMTAAAR